MPKVPSKKTARKAAKAPAAKKAAAKKAVAKKAVTKKAPAKKAVKKAVAKKAPAKKAARKRATPARTGTVTKVIAKFDAGFGNQLYLRGNGAGLTWDKGELMENTGADEWVWQSTKVTSELEFKVIKNDTDWSMGPNGVVFPGSTVVYEPLF